MPWTDTARAKYARDSKRYASDATDDEWSLIEGLLPARRGTGRPRMTDLREVVNALLSMAATGCQWRMLPGDVPPRSTVQRYFYDWRDRGLIPRISHQSGDGGAGDGGPGGEPDGRGDRQPKRQNH